MTLDLKGLIARLRGGDTMSMRPAADALEALVAELDDAKAGWSEQSQHATDWCAENAKTYERAQAAEAEVERLRLGLNRIAGPECGHILATIRDAREIARAALHPAQETADD